MKFNVVIPARYSSTRLPGKALRNLAGKPMVQHVYERGCESSADQVIVATDDERIARAAEAFGAAVCMTGNQHQSGTERIAEVADRSGWDDSQIIVNLQGDEPSMPASLIDQCAGLLHSGRADIATLASPLADSKDFDDPNVVKVIRAVDGSALYFSRAPIPYAREAVNRRRAESAALHHHGIYAYRCGVLRKLVAAAPSDLEICEQLEQLRALSMGMKIAVGVPEVRPGPGVDTAADLERAERELRD
jgi:3-deoxy-manno-octulosonate cytidylyltransferase (CMP-KDO synthetase)